MKSLSISKDGLRLLLVVPNSPPLRAAALAIPGVKREGIIEDSIAFSYPAEPAVCFSVIETFAPDVAPEHSPRIVELMEAKQALDAAVALKEDVSELSFDARLSSDPMAHQIAGMNFGRGMIDAGAPGCALLMEQGTGKSLTAVGLANYLYVKDLINWVFVVAPNSLKGTWGADDGEVLIHTPAHSHRPMILRGTRDKRQAHLARELKRLGSYSCGTALPWLITNVDEFAIDKDKGTTGVRFKGTLDLIKGYGPRGLLIVDESSTCKNWKARRTKALMSLARVFPYRLLLTGTPVEAGPLDVWSQFEILQPGCLGYKTALAFERTYARYERIEVHIGNGRKRLVNVVAGYQNLDDLMNRVAKWSYRVRAADCLDLPPVVARKIPVELTPTQAKTLRALRDDKMADLGDGAYLDGRNILTRLQKMAQVVGGWAKAMSLDGIDLGWQAIGKSNPKLAALEDYLRVAMEDPERKVVIFAEHPETEIVALEEMADRNGWGSVVFHGGVSEKERDERRQQFNTDPETRCFIAQWETAARGLNLAVADTVVFYTLTFRYGTWSQARKRVHRKGQTKTVTEVYLIGEAPRARGKNEKTLDHVQLDSLLNKQNLADVVTGDAAAKIIGGE